MSVRLLGGLRVSRVRSALACTVLAVSLAGQPALAQAQTRIDLQGHRGARGLLPENSLAGFAEALRLGVTTLELDVVMNRDGELVISHDPTLNPDITRDATGRYLSGERPAIIGLTTAQLHSFDVGRIAPGSRYASSFRDQRPLDGTRIPRLRELFDLVKASGNRSVRFAIETKRSPLEPHLTPDPERFAKALMSEISDAGLLERVSILSFDWSTLQVVQRDHPNVPTVYITAQLPAIDNVAARSGGQSPWNAGFTHARHGSVPRMIKAAGGHWWSSFWRELDAASMAEARALGLKVLAWTVNDPAVMRQMLDLGVDGLVTDRPDIAISVLKERGLSW
jgi:glycerophosphoryl diester phosphodiesterase